MNYLLNFETGDFFEATKQGLSDNGLDSFLDCGTRKAIFSDERKTLTEFEKKMAEALCKN